MLINTSGTPSFPSTFQRASRGTESYAFLKSTNIKNCFVQCSTAFSEICRRVNIISLQPRPFLKPHCDSGSNFSASSCNRFWLPPYQLPPTKRSPSSCHSTSNFLFGNGYQDGNPFLWHPLFLPHSSQQVG